MMISKVYTTLFFNICIVLICFAQTPSEFIHIDQFGYLNNAEKVAVISNPIIGYNAAESYTVGGTLQVRNLESDAVVYSAAPMVWNNGATHDQSGDRGWHFDFSSVTASGSYYIFDPSTGHRSAPFEINANPYAEVLQAAFKIFYYNRCNVPKEQPYAQSNWTDGDNFSQDFQVRDAFDQNNAATARDMSGGWFDAGDYNKYTTFAHDVIHDLLTAYEDNPTVYTDDWNIPESGNGVPDILDEIKWELDWLYKMVRVDNNGGADGAAHIKMGSLTYAENVQAPPSANTDPRYYAPTCSSASLSIASINAHAAAVYDDIPGMEGFVDILTSDALLCWNYYLPFHENAAWETDCDDGTVKAGPADWDATKQIGNAVVAAVYLYALTGDVTYSDFVADNINDTEPFVINSLGSRHVVLMEAILYYTTLSGADPTAVNTILSFIANQINVDPGSLYDFYDFDLYRADVPDWVYYWGSNSAKSNFANLFHVFRKYNVVPSANAGLLKRSNEMTHYFHGVNPLGIVYLSNMYEYGADRSANQIFHLWFQDESDWSDALTSPYGPAPGFLVGGPNQGYSGSFSPPANQPVQKCYLDYNNWDPEPSYEITEPAIYYQSAYIRLLSNYVNTTTVITKDNIGVIKNCIQIHPNPTNNYFRVEGNLAGHTIQILNANGSVYSTLTPNGSVAVIDVSDLPAGMFFVRVQDDFNGNVVVEKILKMN